MSLLFALLAIFVLLKGQLYLVHAISTTIVPQQLYPTPEMLVTNVISPAHTPDPAAVFYDGYYYGVRSKIEASPTNVDPPGFNCWAGSQDQIIITKSRTLQDIFTNPESSTVIVDRSSPMGGGWGGISVGAFAVTYHQGDGCPGPGFWAPSLRLLSTDEPSPSLDHNSTNYHHNKRWFIFATGHRPDIQGEVNFVLENIGNDPMNANAWVYRGMLGHRLPGLDGEPIVLPTNDPCAATVTLHDNGKTISGQLYFVYSHNNFRFSGTQQLNLARLQLDDSEFVEYDVDRQMNITFKKVFSVPDPGDDAAISFPMFDWEMKACTGCSFAVNEGPTALYGPTSTFILYSASFCATKYYAIGMLEFKGTGSGMDAENNHESNQGQFPFLWMKYPRPVFSGDLFDHGSLSSNVSQHAFGIGHNQVTVSPDLSEQWMVYHAKTRLQEGPQDREARIQRFAWHADGTPNFLPGPLERGTLIQEPSRAESYAVACGGEKYQGRFCVGLLPVGDIDAPQKGMVTNSSSTFQYDNDELRRRGIVPGHIRSIRIIGRRSLAVSIFYSDSDGGTAEWVRYDDTAVVPHDVVINLQGINVWYTDEKNRLVIAQS